MLVVGNRPPVRPSRRGAASVLDVGSGKEALEVLDDAVRVDLLFSDVVLPGGMNGRELAETVVQQRPGLPVLFTTGYTRNAIIHHGRLDPNVNLLNKPYTQQELGRKLRQLLSNQGTALRRWR